MSANGTPDRSEQDPQGREKRVLIVEDEGLFAYALRMALELDPELIAAGLTSCTVASSVSEALEELDKHHFDLALIDMHLPDGYGLDLGRIIAERSSSTRMLAVTAAIDAELAAQAIEAGFGGYITKDVPLSFLVEAVLRVVADEVVIRMDGDDQSGQSVRDERRYEAEMRPRQLTLREHEVLSLLVRGATTEEIAEELGVATNTARTHIQNVLTKLQVRSRLEAAAFAVRHRVTSPR